MDIAENEENNATNPPTLSAPYSRVMNIYYYNPRILSLVLQK